MKSILIIGGEGEGKTTLAKKILAKVQGNKVIMDLHGDYTEHQKNFAFSGFPAFMDKIASMRDTCFVFEEITPFLRHGKVPDKLIEMLVLRRGGVGRVSGVKGNFFIFLFHSIHSVPMELISFSNYIYLFKTGDNLTYIGQKFKDYPQIIEPIRSRWQGLKKYEFIDIKIR